MEGGGERQSEGAREGHEGCLTVGSEAGKQEARRREKGGAEESRGGNKPCREGGKGR